MKEWYSTTELAGLPGMPRTDRNVRIVAQRERWRTQSRQVGKGSEYHISALPLATQAALAACSSTAPAPSTGPTPSAGPQLDRQPAAAAYDPEALWQWAESRCTSQREEGSRRATLLMQVMRLHDAGRGLRDSFEAIALANDLPWRTLHGWYYGKGKKPAAKDFARCDWAASLIPSYRGRPHQAAFTAHAWEYIKADFLRLEAPSLCACLERATRAAAVHGWTMPSEATVRRRMKALPRAAIIKARHGDQALKRSYPHQERDHAWYGALEAVNADGHTFDVFVKWPDGEVSRPCLLAWQDIYSGKLLSWRIDRTENSDAIRLSFGDLADEWGLPDHAYLDNGRGFASKLLTGGIPNRFRFKVKEEEPWGLLTTAGVEVHWTTPYHGQAKPIERAFLDLCEYVAKHPVCAGAYTGNKPTAKPENYASKAIELEAFVRLVEQEIAAHNARAGRRSPVCRGRSFDQAFAESYASRPIRKPTREQRRLWLLAAENVTVRRDATVALTADRRNRYYLLDLFEHIGDSVTVRFDPQDLHTLVHIYSAKGNYLGEAMCLEKAGFGDTHAAREHARARRAFMRAAKEQLHSERRMSTLEATRLLPDVDAPPSVPPKVVRPFRPARELRDPPPASPAVPDEVRALRERRRAQLREQAQLDALIELTDSPKTNHARWMVLERRIAAGEDIPAQLRQRLADYKATRTFVLMREAFAEHGLDVEEAAG